VQNEKKTLSEKVQVELDKYLQQAVKEKMLADDSMKKAKVDLEAKNKAFEELEKTNKKM